MTFNPDLLAAKPVTEMDWLLQRGDIIESDNTSHIEAVQDAIELLSPQSKFCVEAIFYEGIPYSKLGERLGVSKPHAWRLANKAIEELRQLLTTNKTLNERYDMFDTWDEAASATLKSMDTFSTKRKVEINELDKFVLSLTGFVYDTIYEEAAEMDMGDLGLLAASHLKTVGAWDTEDMTNLLVRKQKDYGHQNILGFGLIGLAVRLCDKIARLKTLEKRGSKPQNESVIDTWMDIVGYSAIARMLSNGTFKLNLKEES